MISFDLAAVYRARQLGRLAVGWVLSDYDAHARLKYEAVQPEFLFCDNDKLPPHGPLWRAVVLTELHPATNSSANQRNQRRFITG